MAETLCLKFEYEPCTKTFLHPYQTAAIKCEGEEVGYLGKVAYDVQSDLGVRGSMYVMEIDLKFLSQWYDRKTMYTPLPKYPEEKRDLALVMDKDITCGQIEECINKSCNYVKSITLFDIYEGEQIPADKKSMAFTVEFCPKEEAFEAESVDRFVNKILKNLKKQMDVDLRS